MMSLSLTDLTQGPLWGDITQTVGVPTLFTSPYLTIVSDKSKNACCATKNQPRMNCSFHKRNLCYLVVIMKRHPETRKALLSPS